MTSYIGTSGFYYDDWKGAFYPEVLKKNEWLPYYAREFRTVEINNTFYHTPRKSSFEKWYKDTPYNFKFTLKGSRYVTHQKKLNDPQEGTGNFYKAISPLAEKTDCILWQLPGNFHFDKEKLENFAKACSKDYVNVMEFRHTSWFTQECYDILDKYKLAFCMISAPGNLPETVLQTCRTAYLRFHGKDAKNRYHYHYSKKELETWANRLKKLNPQRVFIYFNNDYDTNAIDNARTLKELLG